MPVDRPPHRIDAPRFDLDRFAADGYAVLRSFVEPERAAQLASLLERAPERDPGPNPLSLDSMRFASNLFYGTPELVELLGAPPVIEIVTAVLGPDVWVRWDQAVWKGPGAPTFPWHQDNGYTELDAEHLQLWLALTSSTADNGGLVVAPGGHRRRLPHRWVGNHVVATPTGPSETIEAAPGDAVVFSSLLPHTTGPNRTGRTRLAYVAEFLPLDAPDRSVSPPHLVVAAGGLPRPGFVDLTPRWDSQESR